jgi:hypothetical protein
MPRYIDTQHGGSQVSDRLHFYIEVTLLLASAYDFYLQVVKSR